MNSVLVKFTPDLAVLFAVGLLAAGIVTAGEHTRSRPWAGYVLAAILLPVTVCFARLFAAVFEPLPAAPRVDCAATGDVGPAVAAAANRAGRRRRALAGR